MAYFLAEGEELESSRRYIHVEKEFFICLISTPLFKKLWPKLLKSYALDASAVALCRDNNIPIVVFNVRQSGNLARVLAGSGTATIVQNGD